MTNKTTQESRYWLTPAGCKATGGHIPDLTRLACKVCGSSLHPTDSAERTPA